MAWPLVYMEEYRADVNSWKIASRALALASAAQLIIYTLLHRFGLAAQNLRGGRPGAGYVPFLHFEALVTHKALRVVERGGHMLLDVGVRDPASLLEAAMNAAMIVDNEINGRDFTHAPDQSAEAMLAYVVERLNTPELPHTFSRIMRQ